MDGVITMDDARALVGDVKLWPRVRDFLWDFVPQVHESWLEDVLATKNAENAKKGKDTLCDLCALCGKERNAPRVKRYILESLGVEPCFHAFPKEDGSRILLLDGATLESAAKWLGALACAESLRRVTSGEVVRGLKSKFRGIYPEVFSYTAYFNVAAKNADTAKTPEEIVAIGFKMLFSQLADLPKSLVARLKFKLPKSLCELCVLCGKEECAVSRSAVLKLFKLKFPEAYKLCC